MARIVPSDRTPLELEDATPYTASLSSVEYQANNNETHPDWPDQLKFVWTVHSGAEDQELWVWASVKLGQTKGGKVAKLRTILNALAGRKAADAIAWLEDGSDGEPIAWGYPDGVTVAADKGLQLRIIGHNEDGQDGGNRFVVDTFASAKRSVVPNPVADSEPKAPREVREKQAVTPAGVPF